MFRGNKKKNIHRLSRSMALSRHDQASKRRTQTDRHFDFFLFLFCALPIRIPSYIGSHTDITDEGIVSPLPLSSPSQRFGLIADIKIYSSP